MFKDSLSRVFNFNRNNEEEIISKEVECIGCHYENGRARKIFRAVMTRKNGEVLSHEYELMADSCEITSK